MPQFKNKIAFVVATKDRPSELRRLLKNLETQSYKPDQIVIVEGSESPAEDPKKEFSTLKLDYLHSTPPSAARQRNVGIEMVSPDITLIGFLDDDVELEPDAIEIMMRYWENAPEQIAGTALNMVNHPQLYASRLKALKLTEKFGFYSKKRGEVPASGFQTMIGNVSETINTRWLPTTAVIWHRRVFDEFRFDEWFSGYSYLEDLDFSYRVGRKNQLAVVADAKYFHYPALNGRGDDYSFGKREVVNRIYFVKKNEELSLFKCYMGLIIRMFISLTLSVREKQTSYLRRVRGNIGGLIISIMK